MAVSEVDNDGAATLAGAGATFLDVREQHERDTARIPGTVHAPMQESLDWVTQHVPDRDAAIVVTCLSGARSAHVAQHLKQLGYSNVHNHRGGLQAWALQGRDVERGPER